MPDSKLHVEVLEGQGPDLLLLHGFCETSAIWHPWVHRLKGFRRILVDLPGFGHSPLPSRSITLEQVARQLLEMISQLGWAPVVIGHSLGGYVALAMADLQPAWLKGLVLFHSTPFADTAERKAIRTKAIDFVQQQGTAAFTKTLIPTLFFQKNLEAERQLQHLAASTPPATICAYLTAMRDRPDRSAVFQNFTGTKAVVAGTNDSLIPIGLLRQWALENPTIGLTEVQNAGHMGMFEAPEFTSETIIALTRSV